MLDQAVADVPVEVAQVAEACGVVVHVVVTVGIVLVVEGAVGRAEIPGGKGRDVVDVVRPQAVGNVL